jgi:hypothetical protein
MSNKSRFPRRRQVKRETVVAELTMRPGEAPIDAVKRLRACPDCDSEVEVSERSNGAIGVDVTHDPTCPTLYGGEK